MKKIIILMMLPAVLYCQDKMSEKRAMKEKHIDFSKEYIWFEISGLIEIDGHIFKNDTCKCPIIFSANLDGVTISNKCTNTKYEHRVCSHKNCNIIHLQESNKYIFKIDDFYPFYRNSDNNLIYLDSINFIPK